MANIKIEQSYAIADGQPVTFVAPCDCTAITGLNVTYPGGSKEFTFKDAHGNDLTGIGNLFTAGAYVKAILDIVNGYAYLQNADTNAYLEAQLASKRPNTWTPTAEEVGAAPAAGVAYIDKNDNETVILPPSGGDGGDSSPGSGGLTAEQVQAMIDAALGGIENGTY